MNKDDLLEDIKYCGTTDIKVIFDDLVDDSVKLDNSQQIELTDDVLDDLKKLLAILVVEDDTFAEKVKHSLDKEENIPADLGIGMVAGTIMLSVVVCAVLTDRANKRRLSNPNLEQTDCKDILESLKLHKIVSSIFNVSDE